MKTFADELAEWPMSGTDLEREKAVYILTAILHWGTFFARDDAGICYVGRFGRLDCPGDVTTIRIVLSVFDGDHEMAFRPEQVFVERLGWSART
jgi:hypothetical protein